MFRLILFCSLLLITSLSSPLEASAQPSRLVERPKRPLFPEVQVKELPAETLTEPFSTGYTGSYSELIE
ncbi:MAG: hypothetical protein K2Z81_18645, partial [Cyanobacteria bacterium]|nr:hypothetical protein [Cyanobacteriota bacterium]